MADEGIFVTTAEVLRHAGTGASSVSSDEAYVNQYVAEAESYINILTGINYSDSYSSLDQDKRDILKLAAGSFAAIGVAKFDPSNYKSARDQENTINICWQNFVLCMKILTNKGRTTFLSKT